MPSVTSHVPHYQQAISDPERLRPTRHIPQVASYQRPFTGLLAVSWLFVRDLAAHRVKMLVGQGDVEPDRTLV